ERRYRTLFNEMPVGVYRTSVEGKILDANPALASLFGYASPDELAGLVVGDFYIDPQEQVQWREAVAREGVLHESEIRLRRKDGTLIWAHDSGRVIRDESGGVISYEGTLSDVTERKEAEQGLRESEERYRKLVELSPDSIGIHCEGKVVYVNPAAVKLFHANRPEDLVGLPIIQLVHPSYRAIAMERVRLTYENNLPAPLLEEKFVTLDGQSIDVEIRAAPIVHEGKPATQIIIRDITERKQVEEALRHAQEETGHANRLLLALSQAAQAVQRARTQEDVYAAVQDQMTQLGFKATVFELSQEGNTLRIAYLNYASNLVRKAEKMVGLSMSNYRFRPRQGSVFQRVLAQGEAVHVEDTALAVADAIPKGLRALARPVAELFHLQPSTYAALTVDDKTIGVFSVTGAGLTEADNPAVTTFARQAAIAVQNARLYEQAQQEIAERKQAEGRLAASEAELRALFAAMTDAVIVYDVDGRYVKIAPTNPTSLYRRPDTMLGKTVHEILPKEQADYIVAKIGEALHTDQVVHGEYALQVDGKEVWFGSSASRIAENTIVWVVHDITDRKQGEERIQRQVESLGVLYELSRTLSAMDDFGAILDLVTRHAAQSAHVTFACVLLLEQDDLVLRAGFPVRLLDQDLQVGQREPLAAHPLLQRVLEENAARVLEGDSLEGGECAPFYLGVLRSLCVVPLYIRDRPFGLLMLCETRHGAREPFTAEKLRMACSIGDQAVSSLQRALLHEETVRQLGQLEAMHHIDQAIAGSIDVRLTLNVVLEQVTSQLKVDAASVLLLDSHSNTLDCVAVRGFRTGIPKDIHLRLGEGYAGRAALERKPAHIPDLRLRGTDILRSPLVLAEGFVSYHCVPLIAKGQVKGVLEVFHRTWREDDAAWVNYMETLAGQAAIAIDNAQLFENLERSNVGLMLAYDATIEGWSRALDMRDKETEGHTQRVMEMTLHMARTAGLSEEELVHVRRGALLHDMGKLGVPDNILLKPGELTEAEWVIMRKHPAFAYEMLSPITYLHRALDIPYCHHEKWDGSGYPRGLKGEQIPKAARIFALVDVFDALRSDRPYRPAWPLAKAVDHIRSLSGSHFDPDLVEPFLADVMAS
ncbi:MAG: PAS domain S-box protein, partial [Chloroflexi bacterium]|nr:PAS domain S-box protein [Chloroflexota bacterium]